MNSLNFDPVFEAMLRQAVRDNIYEEAESVPDDDMLATMITISAEHDKRMRRLCAREDRREALSAFTRPVKRVAVAAMIAITVLSGALMLNTEVRAAVREVIIEWYEQFTRFVGISEETSETSETTHWSLEYLPNGYEEIGVHEGDPTIIEYENADGNYIVFRYSIAQNELRVDNDESEYTSKVIDGYTYYIFVAENDRKSSTVVWYRDGFRFDLDGYLSVDVLMEIAQTVVKK